MLTYHLTDSFAHTPSAGAEEGGNPKRQDLLIGALGPWQRPVRKRGLAPEEEKDVGSQTELSEDQCTQRHGQEAFQNPGRDAPFQQEGEADAEHERGRHPLREAPRPRRGRQSRQPLRDGDEAVVEGVEWIHRGQEDVPPKNGREDQEEGPRLKYYTGNHDDPDQPRLDHQRRVLEFTGRSGGVPEPLLLNEVQLIGSFHAGLLLPIYSLIGSFSIPLVPRQARGRGFSKKYLLPFFISVIKTELLTPHQKSVLFRIS
jgi:hypothetical protein